MHFVVALQNINTRCFCAFCRFDGRQTHQHTVLKENVGSLSVSRKEATLTMQNMTMESGGIYECRVDFFKSPTHTSLVNLTIIGELNTYSLLMLVDSLSQSCFCYCFDRRYYGDGLLVPFDSYIKVIF